MQLYLILNEALIYLEKLFVIVAVRLRLFGNSSGDCEMMKLIFVRSYIIGGI